MPDQPVVSVEPQNIIGDTRANQTADAIVVEVPRIPDPREVLKLSNQVSVKIGDCRVVREPHHHAVVDAHVE